MEKIKENISLNPHCNSPNNKVSERIKNFNLYFIWQSSYYEEKYVYGYYQASRKRVSKTSKWYDY